MKIGISLFHADIYNIYKKEWVNKCIQSIANQAGTYPIVEILSCELLYSQNPFSDPYVFSHNLPFYVEKRVYENPMKNHAEAASFCFDKLVEENCEYLFMVHLDDYYSPTRITQQIQWLDKGYDLVSSNIQYIHEINGKDVLHEIQPPKLSSFNGKIKQEFKEGHNVIANPVVAMTAAFWKQNRPYNSKLVPNEDYDLYCRGILTNNAKYYIIDNILCYYRIHDKQSCAQSIRDIK